MSLRHLTVRTYSHGYCVSNLSPRGKWLCSVFAKRFAQYGFVQKYGQYQKVNLKVFAAATEDRSEFRFHINTLEQFKEFLITNQVDGLLVKWEEATTYEPQAVEFRIRDGWIPRDFQVPIIDYLSKPLPISRFLDLQTGRGKAQPLDAKIKVPGGWKTMGDMQIGSELLAKDGTTTTVTAVYPQGKKDIYKVTFADGRSTECCAEHLWKVYYINTSPHRRWQVVNTLEMKRLISMPNPRVYVELVETERNPDVVLPLDPYLLGLFLGNAHLGKNALSFTTPDAFTVEEIRKRLPTGMEIRYRERYAYAIVKEKTLLTRNTVLRVLKDLDLSGKLSYDKFIPEVYLHASTEQRLALLQGLLDTDGTAAPKSEGGTVSFCSTSATLASGVQYLVRSLGGIASISLKAPTYTYLGVKRQGRPAYQVNIRYKKPSELFKLPRKKDRTKDEGQYCEQLKLRVSSIDFVGVKEAQCISIAHPDKLYVTDDFIVTHNTFCALQSIANIRTRFAIIVKPMYIEKWVSDVLKTYDVTPEDIIVVQGSSQLMALMMLAKEGKVHAKVIIISNKTYQNYIKLYEKYRAEILDMGYACAPQDFFELLKVGIRLIDEVHQDFHLNMKLDLYSHVPGSISLSATLLNNDPFMEKMYEMVYPVKDRFAGLALNKYIDSFAVHYRFHNPASIRTAEYGGRGYSHGAFEKSVMRNRITLNNYLALIQHVMDVSFMKCEREPKKLLVFAHSIALCTELRQHFERRYPDLRVKRYVEDDPYENLFESDIVFTTLLSAGTAHDIPNLTTVILTQAVDSIQANVQSLGRLRELPDSATQFWYFVCNDIPEHMKYHGRKMEMLAKRAKSFRDVFTGIVV